MIPHNEKDLTNTLHPNQMNRERLRVKARNDGRGWGGKARNGEYLRQYGLY